MFETLKLAKKAKIAKISMCGGAPLMLIFNSYMFE
jgi:hypothetical protein